MKLKLAKNLRKQVLRGHPWVYRDALVGPGEGKAKDQKSVLCSLYDNKGSLAWGYFDPTSPLAVRILSLDKKAPNLKFYENKFSQAFNLRKQIISNDTNAFRLFNGEGDLLPGLVCDIYDQTAVLQFDGKGPKEFWNNIDITSWLIENLKVKTVIDKSRMNDKALGKFSILFGDSCEEIVEVKENGVNFLVNLLHGQKTGFFLDQRDNRQYLKSIVRGRSVLNLFSYTGGFSVYSGLGGASLVASLDISSGAIEMSNKNWEANGLDKNKHKGICEDVFSYLKNTTDTWDMVLVDPPSMAHSEDQKEKAIQKYTELFSQAIKRTNRGGDIFFSSCSSHISFQDFYEIINLALSKNRVNGRVLKISGQGGDHPFPHICHELRYLKFVHLSLNF